MQVGSEGRGRWNGLLPDSTESQGRDTNAVQFGDDSNYTVNSTGSEYNVITQVRICPTRSLPRQSRPSTPAVAAQVTSRSRDAKWPAAPPERQQKPAGWRSRLQTFLCCFVPQARDQYYRPEPETVLIRPPQPPVPPSHVGPAVLGPIQAQVLPQNPYYQPA